MTKAGIPEVRRVDFRELCLDQSQMLAEQVFETAERPYDPEVTLIELTESANGELAAVQYPADPSRTELLTKAFTEARRVAREEYQARSSLTMLNGPVDLQIAPCHLEGVLASLRSPGRRLFSSKLAEVESQEYLVVILELDEFQVTRSSEFLLSIAKMYLEACVQTIKSGTARSAFQFHWSVGEILKRAASEMLRSAAMDLIDAWVPFELFEHIARISSLPYEGVSAQAIISVPPAQDRDRALEVRFREPIPLYDHLTVRKHLELCNSSSMLISDGSRLLGLAKAAHADAITVQIVARGSWTISRGGTCCVHVVDGHPVPIRGPTEDEDIAFGIQLLFSGESGDCHDKILSLARTTRSLPHGALVVVGHDAQAESDRLAAQCTRLEPVEVTPEFLASATRIDGATLIDLKGICHGIGAILDGRASKNCTRARGSRFNSALRYVESDPRRMAFVKSEDGLFDVLPAAAVRFEWPLIDRELNELEAAMVSRNRSRVTRGLNRLMRRSHQLDEQQCERVNGVARQALQAFSKDGSRTLSEWNDLTPT